jgi:hypothetical protein
MNDTKKHSYSLEDNPVISFDNDILYDEWMNVSNRNSFSIESINYVDFCDKIYHDNINVTLEIYKKDFTKDEVIEAFEHFRQNSHLNQCTGGIYMMCGGKEGQLPGGHACGGMWIKLIFNYIFIIQQKGSSYCLFVVKNSVDNPLKNV